MIATSVKDRADAAFKKQERIRQGANALSEYQAATAAEENKTERLRSLRLAKAAEETPVLVKRKARRA